jgi:DNA-binding beta-propeller fold protein YncE
MSLGRFPDKLAFDGADVWVTNYGDNTVMRLDGHNGKVIHTFRVQGLPVPILWDGGSIWVADYLGNTVNKISQTSR